MVDTIWPLGEVKRRRNDHRLILEEWIEELVTTWDFNDSSHQLQNSPSERLNMTPLAWTSAEAKETTTIDLPPGVAYEQQPEPPQHLKTESCWLIYSHQLDIFLSSAGCHGNRNVHFWFIPQEDDDDWGRRSALLSSTNVVVGGTRGERKNEKRNFCKVEWSSWRNKTKRRNERSEELFFLSKQLHRLVVLYFSNPL